MAKRFYFGSCSLLKNRSSWVKQSRNGACTCCCWVTVRVKAPCLEQVVGAKVVTNARSPGARCYGFVTMSTAEEATKCITHLHKTELHGKIISVEKVSTGPQRYPITTTLYTLPRPHSQLTTCKINSRPKMNPLGRSQVKKRRTKQRKNRSARGTVVKLLCPKGFCCSSVCVDVSVRTELQ